VDGDFALSAGAGTMVGVEMDPWQLHDPGALLEEVARRHGLRPGLVVSARRSLSKPPPGGGARVGKVGAIRTGADGTAEMLAELGMVLTDPGYRLADRAGHTGSSALGRGCGSSIATTQANCARELSNEEVAFGVGLRGPLSVPDGARLLDVVVDLGEASAVGALCSCVEDLARVAESRARQAGRLAAVSLRNAAGLGGDEVQHVELPARIGESRAR